MPFFETEPYAFVTPVFQLSDIDDFRLNIILGPQFGSNLFHLRLLFFKRLLLSPVRTKYYSPGRSAAEAWELQSMVQEACRAGIRGVSFLCNLLCPHKMFWKAQAEEKRRPDTPTTCHRRLLNWYINFDHPLCRPYRPLKSTYAIPRPPLRCDLVWGVHSDGILTKKNHSRF